MISVSDNQLRMVAEAADLLPAEARGTFLRRVVAEAAWMVRQAIHRTLQDMMPHILDRRLAWMPSAIFLASSAWPW